MRFLLQAVRWLPILILAVSGGCSISHPPESDSETHFLVPCIASCPADLECLCGACTQPCREDQGCSHLAEDAICALTADAPASACGSTLSVKGTCQRAEPEPAPECLPAGQDVLVGHLYLYDSGWFLSDLTTGAESAVDPTGYRVLQGSLSVDLYGGAPSTGLSALHCMREIRGSASLAYMDDVTDLSALSDLRTVQEWLGVSYSPRLRSLAGLEGLEAVGGLDVSDNPRLTDVDAIVHLTDTGITLTRNGLTALPRFDWEHVTVYLEDNGLRDLASLRGVTRLQGLYVYEPELSDLEDLTSLVSADVLSLTDPPGSDLRALANLREVRELQVSGHRDRELVNLHGLEGLTVVESLRLSADSLQNLVGLSGLVDVTHHLSISGDSLSSLRGLDSLRHITGVLHLQHLPQATYMPGLERIQTLGGLDITTLSQGAVGLPALPELERVTGDVTFYGNRHLQDLGSLAALTRIDGNVLIDQNHALTDLRGLSALRLIGGDLAIGFNDALVSLEGLAPDLALQGGLIVLGNPQLPSARADSLAQGTGRSCDCGVYWTEYCSRCAAPCACAESRTP